MNSRKQSAAKRAISKISTPPNFVYWLITLLLFACLLVFINKHGVNLLFSDHWAYLTPLFNQAGWWSRFIWQHGPHRQGIGFVISGALLESSNWNTLYDAYFMVVILLAASVACLSLIARLRGYLTLSDIAFPILILSPLHYETIILAPNSSHSIVPLLLILLATHALLMQQFILKLMCIWFLGSIQLFTGFAFFAGALCLSYVVLASIIHGMRREALPVSLLTLVLTAATVWLFVHDYVSSGVSSEFSIDTPLSPEHFKFFSYFLAGIFQVREPYALSMGIGLAILLSCALISQLIKLYRTREPSALLSIYLITATLIYGMALTFGRVETTANFAQGSRYMALIIPGLLGTYLWSLQSRRTLTNLVCAVFLLLSLRNLTLDTTHRDVLNGFQQIKRQLLEAYHPDRSLAEIQTKAGALWLGASEERLQQLRTMGVHLPKERQAL